MNDFVEICRDEGDWKEHSSRTLMYYLRPFVNYVEHNKTSVNSTVLATFFKQSKYALSSKARIAKAIIHFVSWAKPDVVL